MSWSAVAAVVDDLLERRAELVAQAGAYYDQLGARRWSDDLEKNAPKS